MKAQASVGKLPDEVSEPQPHLLIWCTVAVSAWSTSFLLFLFLLPFWFDGFWTPDDNEMKARAWWNTMLLRLRLMDDMSLLFWAWPAHTNSPKARSPFVSIALFAYISPFYVPTSVTLPISFGFLLFHLNFPPFLPVAAINLEKLEQLPKIIWFHYEPP